MILQITKRIVGADTAVITLSGALTLGTSLKTADMQIQDVLDGGLHRLVLEMSGVPYLDSAGLGLLVHAAGLSAERGGALRLAAVTERVASLLRLTHVDTLLPTDANEAEALAALGHP